MRIVTRLARHRAVAPEEALRLAKPVRGAADNFELTFVSRPRRMIEHQQKVAERLPRHKRKWSPVETPDQRGQRAARRLEVALHAQIHLQARTEPRWIHDTRAHVFQLRARGLHNAKVIAARAVTSLAIDAF